MNGKDIELTRRRVLGGIATVGVASAAVGAGTFAAFSDTETSDGNSVTAGTLDLQLSPTGSSASINFTDIAPGGEGYIAFELTNNGGVGGDLGVNIGDTSGGFTESLVSENDGTPTDIEDDGATDEALLDEHLDIEVFIEPTTGDFDGTTGTTQDSTIGKSGNAIDVVSGDLADELGEHQPNSTVPLDTGTKVLVFNYSLPKASTPNGVQGDSVTFDIQVELIQT